MRKLIQAVISVTIFETFFGFQTNLQLDDFSHGALLWGTTNIFDTFTGFDFGIDFETLVASHTRASYEKGFNVNKTDLKKECTKK